MSRSKDPKLISRLIKQSGLGKLDSKTMETVQRICSIDFSNIFRYRTLDEANALCEAINSIKERSTMAFKPFLSSSTKTLCHSMGNPLRIAEDIVELEDKRSVLNGLLKIVSHISYKYGLYASEAALSGECVFSEYNFVFDEEKQTSYRKEIAHMSRYFRLHAGSYLAVEFAKQLPRYPKSSLYSINAFAMVMELYEKGAADYIFNIVREDGEMRERLVTPILIDTKFGKVMGVHVYGHDKIRLWKRWGDSYSDLRNISDGTGSDVKMDLTPFMHGVAIM